MNLTTSFVALSAERSNLDAETNAGRHRLMLGQLLELGIPFTVVKGVYHGVEERSVLIPGGLLHVAILLAAKYDQECVLAVAADRTAELISRDGKRTPIGKWRRVGKVGKLAKLPDACTIARDGSVYVAA
jgi:hypothetical protein